MTTLTTNAWSTMPCAASWCDRCNMPRSTVWPATHHFYITFRTDHPQASVGDDLKSKYPEEITIVLQHQFWDLKVDDDGFSVALSFNQSPQTLQVPYAAVTAFVDPSVKFGLQFKPTLEGEREPAFGTDDADQ